MPATQTAEMENQLHAAFLKRFMAKVAIQGLQPGGCWIWTGAITRQYGTFTVVTTAGRWTTGQPTSFDHFIEPVNGREVTHLCANDLCVNPAHLTAYARAENPKRKSKKNLQERFWPKVDKGDCLQPGGCWIWKGYTDTAGYGRFQLKGNVPAQRIAFMLQRGPIPDGADLDHLCRVRNCVNPSHLEPVSRAENVTRGESPPAKNARKTHCPRGHEYSPDNTYVPPAGGRQCRSCKLERERRYHAAKRHRRFN